ncbi:MAG: alkaline phosphatase [Planctomycetota bacterium]
MSKFGLLFVTLVVVCLLPTPHSIVVSQEVAAQDEETNLRSLQFQAVELNQASWAHWGPRKDRFSSWTNHSNRLIPVFSFGLKLNPVRGKKSLYRDEAKIKSLYGYLPEGTFNPEAKYFDQTDIYQLHQQARSKGKKHIILFVFDGMDWQTLQAAAIYRDKQVNYSKGKGRGIAFQDYKNGQPNFGFCVTSPHNGDTKTDVDSQVVLVPGTERRGGFSFQLGGSFPWDRLVDAQYLTGQRRTMRHAYTDSAASATSLNAGVKTFNGSINIAPDGKQITTLAHELQKDGFGIGVISSVPISHATPACVYSHNVTRSDYQDLTRDLLGLKSVAHREQPLPGVDVLIGGGWGEMSKEDNRQGINFVPGNKYLAKQDLDQIDVANDGKYVVVQRMEGTDGSKALAEAANEAAENKQRLFGFFGTGGGHLPYATADGGYDPTRGVSRADRYDEGTIKENPTLAEMTAAALTVLEKNETGFYLMVESGDVDWANHNNNIDDSIGAVFSGEAAFQVATDWVDANSNWDESCVVVTADHGHYFVLDDPRGLTGELEPMPEAEFKKAREEKQARDRAKEKAKENK